MGDLDNAKCLLCGSNAEANIYDGPRGEKIDNCEGGCPPYAIDAREVSGMDSGNSAIGSEAYGSGVK